jgi:hypothetical protein
MNGFYISDIISINRGGGGHYFGSSNSEKGKFTPKILLPEHSLNFMKGMLCIAKYIEKERNVKVYKRIVKDIGNYSYPFMSIHARNKKAFVKNCYGLSKMGLWTNKFFWFYFLGLLFFGPHISSKMIRKVKNIIGHTPLLSKIYSGEIVDI